jgi:hypothetical protein
VRSFAPLLWQQQVYMTDDFFNKKVTKRKGDKNTGKTNQGERGNTCKVSGNNLFGYENQDNSKYNLNMNLIFSHSNFPNPAKLELSALTKLFLAQKTRK